MRLRSHGSTLELTINGYQFPDASSRSRSFDHDANWLEIHGVIDIDGVGWSFDDPCLLTVEAQELGRWLRDAARGGSPEDLWFLEPNLVFGLSDKTAECVTVRVTFSHESAPRDDSAAPDQVILRLTPQELATAATEWEKELAAYPMR